MHLVHNERTKLTANWCNTLATALIAAGTFAPVAAGFYGVSASHGSNYIFVFALGCFALGLGLHVAGRTLLGRLRE
jgi:hypothetical protein